MKKIIYTLGLALTISSITAGCSKVPAGYQGVIVNLYGNDKGVSEQTVGVGRYFLGINKEMFLFPTFLQNYTWTKADDKDESIYMQTNEGLQIDADVGITYQIQPDNVVKVFQRYRLGIDEITSIFLRNMVRDAMNQVASNMSIEDMYSNGKTKFLESVIKIVKPEAMANGINVDQIYLVGSFRLPDAVQQSINQKIQATQNAQRVENEVAISKAEAQKTIIAAQAQAEANRLLDQSLTPQYIQYLSVQKWDGILPKVTGGATPFIGVGNDK